MSEKLAVTQIPINELLAKRWSPRAYDPQRSVSREQIIALLEAARWAPSCFGEQPWRFIVCDKSINSIAYDKAFACLAEGNQVWVKNAPLLLLAIANTQFTLKKTSAEFNRWHEYDTGAASENLCLQAVSLGLAARQMGGFDVEKIKIAFQIPDTYTCMAVIAVGYQGDGEGLPDWQKSAEASARNRNPLQDLCFEGEWNVPVQI